MEIESPAEVILWDTSFINHSERALRSPEKYRHWSREALDRVSGAVAAITPFTLAEVRFGYVDAGWSPASRAATENALSAFVLIPLDERVLDTYVDLKVTCKRRGRAISFHDCWIAATAISQEIALASSDKAHRDLPGLETIYFPPPR